MKNAYTISFTSSVQGKLKCLIYFNDKVVKAKTLPIMATLKEIKEPYPQLEQVLLNMRTKFNRLVIECFDTDKSPAKLMFDDNTPSPKSPYQFFENIYDHRLKRWVKFIDRDLQWKDLTDELFMDFKSHLEDEDIATNSCRTYMSGLKKTIDEARRRGFKFPSQDYAAILKSPIAKSISIYLTVEELQKIEGLELSGKLDEVRTAFLIGCYSGARYSDFSKLRIADIQSGEVRYISEKTGSLVYVPLHPSLPDLLAKVANVTNAQINRLLPEIGKLAGICSMVTVVRGDVKKESEKYNHIKSHTARRTFATNCYLSNEYDLRSVSKFLGHASIETTEKYLSCGVYPNTREIKSYFTK